jgi:hypothetical protein
MKHHVSVAIVFLIGCAAGGVASQLVVPPIRAGTTPQRSEYLCTQASATTSSLTSHLNQFGAQGWELVSTTGVSLDAAHRTDAFVFCFRRAL